jgi:glutathione synthase
MNKNILIVTDHTTHSSSNSLYELALAIHNDKRSGDVWVCSRGLPENKEFFAGKPVEEVYASKVNYDFAFNPDHAVLMRSSVALSLDMISAILIRMPQPLDKVFLNSLADIRPAKTIINDVKGTIETSSKQFLTTIPHLCPSPEMCYSAKDALALSHQYEIVLKPMFSYGGRGIVRLSPDYFWLGDQRFAAKEIFTYLTDEFFPMLAMRYLKNVEMGDKRTIVVNQKILGSALRMPPPDSWICNIAHGGHAMFSEPDEAELAIEKELTPMLYEKGVIMYGFDTLVDDDGKRVLSEINTLSIGGLGPIEEMSGRPVLQQAASLIWDYIEKQE